MTELEKAPTVGAFSEIAVRSTNAFFDALVGDSVCLCGRDGAKPRAWRVPTKDDQGRWQAPTTEDGHPVLNMRGYSCDRCEATAQRVKSYLTAAAASRLKARTAPDGEWQAALDAARGWDERAATELEAVA